jgi:hypothetical protein
MAANRASEAKKEANLNEALDAHARAARLFKDAALAVRESNGMLLLLYCQLVMVVVIGKHHS